MKNTMELTTVERGEAAGLAEVPPSSLVRVVGGDQWGNTAMRTPYNAVTGGDWDKLSCVGQAGYVGELVNTGSMIAGALPMLKGANAGVRAVKGVLGVVGAKIASGWVRQGVFVNHLENCNASRAKH